LAVALLFAAAAYPAAAGYKDPRLVPVMQVLAVSVLIGGFNNPRLVMLTKGLAFRQQFILDVSIKVSALMISLSIAMLYKSYWALILGVVGGQLVGVVISYLLFPFLPRLSVRHGRELWSFSMWLTLGQIMNTINWRMDHLLIGGFLGRPTLGYYTVGDNLAVFPTREATAPIGQTLFPAFSQLVGDRVRLRVAYQSAQALVTAIALPLGVGVAVLADPMVRLLMGEKWLPAVIVIQILASVFALQTLGSANQPLAMATGDTKLLFKRDLQGFIFRIPMIVAGMLLGGMQGILYARAFVGTVGIVLALNVVKKITGLTFREQLAVNWRALTSVALMAVVVLLVEYLFGHPTTNIGLFIKLAGSAAAGGVTYLGCTAVLWRIAGRPRGPETEVVAMGGNLVKKVRSRRG
jgi:PST family polysaccharide transporter